MKALWLIAITAILTACFDSSTITGDPGTTDGGNGSGPSGDAISGQWTGEWTNSSTLLESCGTESAPFELNINQTGANVTANASLDCTGTAIDNLLNGTVSGSEILLTDANNRDTFTLVIESPTAISGTVVDVTETISADIRISR